MARFKRSLFEFEPSAKTLYVKVSGTGGVKLRIVRRDLLRGFLWSE